MGYLDCEIMNKLKKIKPESTRNNFRTTQFKTGK
jgi:hypothetical protein